MRDDLMRKNTGTAARKFETENYSLDRLLSENLFIVELGSFVLYIYLRIVIK